MRSEVLEGFSKYIIYEDGSVWSTITESYISPVWNGNYLCLNMHHDSGRKSLEKVHRLVAMCFVDNPNNYRFVGHVVEDRTNNTPSNLYWRKGNRANPTKHGNKVGDERLTPDDTQRLQTLCGCSHDNIIKMMRNNLSEEEMYLGGIRFSELVDYNGSRAWSVAEGKRANGRKVRYEVKKKKQKDAVERAERKAREKEQRAERVKRHKENLLHGVGLFDYWNVDSRNKDVEQVWNLMITRCYSKDVVSYSNYGERGVVVCDEWLTYSKYHEWYLKHLPEDTSVKYVIDKDVLSGRDKRYSPDTCVFIPWEVNHLLRCSGKITLMESRGQYKMDTKEDGERVVYFGTVEEVVYKWKMNKKRRCREYIKKYKTLPPKVREFLEDYDPVEFSKISKGEFKVVIIDRYRTVVQEQFF